MITFSTWIIVIISLLSNVCAQTVIGLACNSSIECISKTNSTICCQSGKCVHQDKCILSTKMAYLASGLVGIGVLIFVMIYFLHIINQSRKNVFIVKMEMEAANKEN